MPEPIHLPGGIVIPADALEQRAVRSSGPGGQNVNKVASKIELRLDLSRVRGLSGSARGNLLKTARKRIDSAGRLVVTSQRYRDQGRNLQDAREKIAELLARASTPRKRRIPTQPAASSRERRLEAKRRRALLKRSRESRGTDEY
jgi:ribosome-associated protein